MKQRRSIRLADYDYSSNGAYFVTICTQQRVCRFGDIHDGEMHVNDIGRMIEKWWCALETRFANIQCDTFVIMPNHIHGIILINTTQNEYTAIDTTIHDPIQENHQVSTSLPTMVQWFKTMSTNEYIRRVKTKSWPRFDKRVWQRNYWEHVIRNEPQLREIREYIENNPLKWHYDQLNPSVSNIPF